MTSPQEAKRLVGHHSPAQEEGSSAAGAAPFDPAAEAMVWLDSWTKVRGGHGECARSIKAEIDRLRVALRAVRACTDDSWRAQIIRDALREGQP